MSVVLITGGAGFIGTNLARRLLASDVRVRIFDSLSRPGSSRNIEQLAQDFPYSLEFMLGDVRDSDEVRAAMKGVDYVAHLAAQVAVTRSLTHPLEDFSTNVRGTLNVLEAARRSDPQPAILFTSTNKVYGALRDVELQRAGVSYEPRRREIAARGVAETQALDFCSPYGCSKGAADQYVLDYARSFDLQTVVMRMSCIYGPHQNGTEDQGWVAHFVRRALARQPITLYGDGFQVRDLLFVDDLIDAFDLAFRNIDRLHGTAFNIGGGPANAASVVEVIRAIERLLGWPIDVEFGDWRVGDQRYYVSDSRRYEDATGWRPKVDITTGLGRLCRWFVSQESVEELPAPSSAALGTQAQASR